MNVSELEALLREALNSPLEMLSAAEMRELRDVLEEILESIDEEESDDG